MSVGHIPEADVDLCFAASAPTLSLFLFSGMRYTLALALTNMEVLESRNSHPYVLRKAQSARAK